MRQAFNISIVIVLALLLANRAVIRAQAHEQGALTCAQGSELVKTDAIARGFTALGARSQAENFLSNCLITGQGQVGKLVAHD